MTTTNSKHLQDARNRIGELIKENPVTVSIIRKEMVDDGFGGEVTSPTGSETTHEVEIRIAHERKSAPDKDLAPVGLSTNLGRMIFARHNADLQEHDVFFAIDKYWRINTVDQLIKFGGVYGLQANITEAEYYGNENT